MYGLIREELLEIKERFADPRRTRSSPPQGELDIEDLIADEEVVVTLTHLGYIKRVPVDTYRAQRRGGRGITALATPGKGTSWSTSLSPRPTLRALFHKPGPGLPAARAYEIPEASRERPGNGPGQPAPPGGGEQVTATSAIEEFDDDRYLSWPPARASVKKTALTEFDTPRNGIIAINLAEGDELVDVFLTDGRKD